MKGMKMPLNVNCTQFHYDGVCTHQAAPRKLFVAAKCIVWLWHQSRHSDPRETDRTCALCTPKANPILNVNEVNGNAVTAQMTHAEAVGMLSDLAEEKERLQKIIDSRPAINAGLPETYIKWSQGIMQTDIARAIDHGGAQKWGGMRGTEAFSIIERHSDDWNEAGEMMEAWLRANGGTVPNE